MKGCTIYKTDSVNGPFNSEEHRTLLQVAILLMPP
jgi:hypothetical protein